MVSQARQVPLGEKVGSLSYPSLETVRYFVRKYSLVSSVSLEEVLEEEGWKLHRFLGGRCADWKSTPHSLSETVERIKRCELVTTRSNP